jgi:hypothetical protein
MHQPLASPSESTGTIRPNGQLIGSDEKSHLVIAGDMWAVEDGGVRASLRQRHAPIRTV